MHPLPNRFTRNYSKTFLSVYDIKIWNPISPIDVLSLLTLLKVPSSKISYKTENPPESICTVRVKKTSDTRQLLIPVIKGKSKCYFVQRYVMQDDGQNDTASLFITRQTRGTETVFGLTSVAEIAVWTVVIQVMLYNACVVVFRWWFARQPPARPPAARRRTNYPRSRKQTSKFDLSKILQ